ncbi:hypothetical protein AB0K87_31115, partial [Streptomyces sp. NPDC053705]
SDEDLDRLWPGTDPEDTCRELAAGPGEPPPPPVVPEEPPASPEPEPSSPPEQPSASPAAQTHTDAAGMPERVGTWPTPRVSPQVAPV